MIFLKVYDSHISKCLLQTKKGRCWGEFVDKKNSLKEEFLPKNHIFSHFLTLDRFPMKLAVVS